MSNIVQDITDQVYKLQKLIDNFTYTKENMDVIKLTMNDTDELFKAAKDMVIKNSNDIDRVGLFTIASKYYVQLDDVQRVVDNYYTQKENSKNGAEAEGNNC